MQLLVASGPGATTDISARLVGRYLGKHIPGNPNIVVQNMPGAGGVVAANHLYNVAKPDGLTIAAKSRANYIEQMVGRPEVKTDFRKLSWIGSFDKSPMMVACRSDHLPNKFCSGDLADGEHVFPLGRFGGWVEASTSLQ